MLARATQQTSLYNKRLLKLKLRPKGCPYSSSWRWGGGGGGGLPALISTIEGLFIIQVYLRRQQERGLMQKARRLIEENSVSFQMFLILLSSVTLGSESQISVFKQCQSNT